MTRVAELQGNFAGTCCNRGKLPVSNAAFARCKGNTWGQCGSMVAIVRFIWFKLKAAWISPLFQLPCSSQCCCKEDLDSFLTSLTAAADYDTFLKAVFWLGFGPACLVQTKMHDRWCWTMDWDNRRAVLTSQLAWLKWSNLKQIMIHKLPGGWYSCCCAWESADSGLGFACHSFVNRRWLQFGKVQNDFWLVSTAGICACCTGNHSRWAWAYCTWCGLQIGLPTCANTTRGVPRPFGRMWNW